MEMIMKPADTCSVSAGRRNPENTPLVALVHEKGEVTITFEGTTMVLVRKPKAPYQAFPKDSAGYDLLGRLFLSRRGEKMTVTVVESAV